MAPANLIGERAIVIGGSIAGMLAARVLAEKFASVEILDRDRLPLEATPRRGVPQSSQPHVLFARGYRILEALFPEIGNDLRARGAIEIDWAREFRYCWGEQWNQPAPTPTDLVSFTCTRPLLETTIRQHLSRWSAVQFRENYRVEGLLGEPSRKAIAGVIARNPDGDREQLSASFVVDASGRGSLAPQWLEALGYAAPAKTVVDPGLGYATRRYRIPEGFQADWKVMLINQEPPHNPRLGYLARVEGNEWIATLGGYGREFPPLEETGFLAFARQLGNPAFCKAIASAEPITEIRAHRATTNRLYHYDRAQLPLGFAALGDAVCALCPVYGQGMTTSAISATVLQNWLARQSQTEHLETNRFQSQLARSLSLPWEVATAQDSRFPTTEGAIATGENPLGRLLGRYTGRVLLGVTSDPWLNTLCMEIAHMVKSPAYFFHPRAVWSVIR